MPHYLITNENKSGVGLKAHTLKQNFYVGRYSLMFLVLFFVGILSFVYLVHFNGTATRGYEIARLEYERDELLNKREQNNISLSESQTLEFVKNSSRIQQMRTPKEVNYYWPVKDNEVALAK
ncbi:hypothetical protein COV81_02455 [Candidatus Peregrinibacteria bacterium CG11_big_fil_rev_8_21_14_0_20_41_10]|nr:MAG: hypothetical protein COV81_02455 [Candidatus Peregrinibacteria bacterium CG11_big_fil_rev_8_21_14_0_20_41_10]PIZ76612.1 MAG: hypothetical protein COY06_01650 [Candidatus Peregrinibacteria bacterium CG_4_10_14_0_2_um_filter_41_8]PJC38164.1 MAG: hypothetical protein CO045_01735 [Candidatus Peregrinibacteria bacterium CG_4_9_14_0_2_um_filter_41_14]